MAKVDEKVMALVEAELSENPDTSSADLFEKAKAAAPSIGKLTLRQFHARYPLQVKRRAGAAKRKRSRKKAAPGKAAATRRPRGRKAAAQDPREAVRAVLMRFATELASAEAKAEVVKVLAGADRYVDEVIEAASA